jgi:hypothetical protein
MKAEDKKVYFVNDYSNGCEASYDICRGIYHKGNRSSCSFFYKVKSLTKDINYWKHIDINSSGKGSYIYCNQPNALKRIKEIRVKKIKARIKELQNQIREYETMIGDV